MMTYRLNDVRSLCALLCLLLRYTFGEELECESTMLRSQEGVYSYISSGLPQFCSLYVVAPVDRVIEFEFTAFDVSCMNGAAVGIFDGWEVDTSIFPSDEDHPMSRGHRYAQFCGDEAPTRRLYTAKQNAAQIQIYIPNYGEGFSVRVSFRQNRKPCNMLLTGNSAADITVKNYGMARNCTVLSFYPQEIRFAWLNVGVRRDSPDIFALVGAPHNQLSTNCPGDRIELFQGIGVGLEGRELVLGFCGRRLDGLSEPIILGCESSTVRLVSSGKYYNSFNFAVRPLDEALRTCF